MVQQQKLQFFKVLHLGWQKVDIVAGQIYLDKRFDFGHVRKVPGYNAVAFEPDRHKVLLLSQKLEYLF